MSDAALLATVKAADLELAAAEEDELDSGSESDTDEEEPSSPTVAAIAAAGVHGDKGDTDEEAAGAVTPPTKEQDSAGSPEIGGSLSGFRAGSAAAIKQIRAPLEALFKRRGFGTPSFSDSGAAVGLDARRSALLAALQGNTSTLQPGRYVVEVDSHGEQHVLNCCCALASVCCYKPDTGRLHKHACSYTAAYRLPAYLCCCLDCLCCGSRCGKKHSSAWREAPPFIRNNTSTRCSKHSSRRHCCNHCPSTTICSNLNSIAKWVCP